MTVQFAITRRNGCLQIAIVGRSEKMKESIIAMTLAEYIAKALEIFNRGVERGKAIGKESNGDNRRDSHGART